MKKTFKVKLRISYDLYLLASAYDENAAIDDIEKQVKKLDDYEIVNRAVAKKTMEIVELIEVDNTKKR